MKKLFVLFLTLLPLNCIKYEEYPHDAKLEDIIGSSDYKDVCLPSNDQMQKYFKEHEDLEYKSEYDKDNKIKFIAGKCNPITLIPGIYSTKLKVSIKCKNLYREEKDLYDKIKFYCGKKVCEKTNSNDEYKDLWFNIGHDGFTLYRNPWELLGKNETDLKENDEFESTEDTWNWDNLYGACLGFFFRIFNDENECPVIPSSNKKICGYSNSITISYQGGFYDDYKEDSECGLKAISNIMSSTFIWDIDATNIFGKLINGLTDMGYVKGFSLTGIPYDFRRFISTNEYARKVLKYHIETLYDNTGKPVIIIAHSFGNLITLNALNQLIKEDETLKTKIKKWISIAPPFAGATKAIDNFLYGTDDFNKKIYKNWDAVEFEKFGQMLMLRSVPTMYELKPFHIFYKLFKSTEYQDFAEAIRERIELENTCGKSTLDLKCTKEFIKEKSVKFNSIFRFYFPSLEDEECAIETSIGGNQEALSKKCFTQLYNIVDCPTFLKIKDSNKLEETDIEGYCNTDGDDIYYNADCEEKNCAENIFYEAPCVKDSFEEWTIFINRFKNRYGKEISKDDAKFFETCAEETEKIKEMNKYQNEKSLIKDLPIPPVDIDIVYSTFNPTLVAEITDQNLEFPKQVKKGGDGTVPTWSSLLTAFKWIYDKEKNKLPQNIRLVEYCSRIDGSKLLLSDFIPISCSCIENNVYKDNLEDCDHQNMLKDEKNLFYYIYDEISEDKFEFGEKLDAIKNYSLTKDYLGDCNYKLFVYSNNEKEIKCSDDIEITSKQYEVNHCKQGYEPIPGRKCCSVHLKGTNDDKTKYDSYFCDNIINDDDSIEIYKEELKKKKMHFENDYDISVDVICSSNTLSDYINLIKTLLLLLL